MSVIQQIYCTHCSHGSSALERREGELAHRMLGYSARAGSLEAQELRKCYRQIERYAYYYLPRDTPGEEKLRLIAASAPRRLIFYPSTGGLQVAGQVCYRQTDTEGRPGSYFAHVLFQDEQDGQGRWSPADCLKLWNARGWVDEDSTTIPFLLRSLYSLSEMYQNARPAIDDGVLRSFLTTPAGGNFDDPAGVIPPRYRVAPPKQRITLLADVFRGLLEIDFSQRESLLVVVEPSLAALLFYGIVRLLPAGPLQGGISFSTYEPNLERLGTTLAATIFHDPLRTDLRPDAYRSRGFAVNTFLDRRTDFRQPQAAYAVTMLQRLVSEGWDAVDRMLVNLAAVGAKTAEDFDALAAVDRIVPALFDPRQPLPGDGWRRSPMAIRYLRRILGRRLAELADPRALESLVGRPQHLLVLELIAAEPDAAGTRAAAEYLLRQLPGERMGDLLRLEEISPEAKADVLARHVTAQGALPPGCDQLWQNAGAAAGVAAKHSDVFVLALVSSCRHVGRIGNPSGKGADLVDGLPIHPTEKPASTLSPRLTEIVGAMSEESLVSLYRSHGPGFFKDYPADEPALGRRLHELIQSLPNHLGQFRDRLDLITAGAHLFPEDDDQTEATAWSTCRAAILDIGRLQDQRGGMFRQPPMDQIEAAARRMTEAIVRALPRDRFEDDRTGSNKRRCLERLGPHLLAGKPLLPRNRWQFAAIWQKVAWRFEQGVWPSAPLWKLRPKSKLPVPPWLLLGILVVLALLTVALVVVNRSTGPQEAAAVSGKAGAAAGLSSTEESTAGQAGGGAQEEKLRLQEARRRELARRAELDRQQETAEAARKKAAEEENQRQEREAEEKRRAAAEEARRMAENPPASKPPPTKPSPEVESPLPLRADADAWKTAAERFARDHLGRFIDDEPLIDGQAEIPLEILPRATAGTTWFLGNGRIYLDNGTYPFGDGFEKDLPNVRYEIPKLAADLHLKSAFVELHPRGDVLQLVVGGVPADPPGESEADRKARMADLTQRINKLMVRLRAYRGTNTSDEKKDEAYRAIIELAQIKFPQVPPRPDPGDPKYHPRPNVINADKYNADVKVYKDASAQNDAMHAAVPEIGNRKLLEYRKELENLVNELRQPRRENDPALEALKKRCQKISALIYQPVSRRESAPAGDAPSSPADQPGKPAVPATPPATGTTGGSSGSGESPAGQATGGAHAENPPDHAAADSAPPIDGAFHYEKRPITGLRTPVMAKVRFAVTAEGGKKLPPNLRRSVVIGSLLIEKDKEGMMRLMETPEIQVQEVGTPIANLIYQDAVSLRPQIRFFRPPADRFQSKLELAAVSTGQSIEPVEENCEYVVRFDISAAGMEKLQGLLKEH
jgi:hypothetical protein